MTINQALTRATRQLTGFSTSPELDAELLLTHSLNKDKTYLYTNPQHRLNWPTRLQFWFLIQKRKHHQPIAHLTKHQEFYGYDFMVNRHVLVPRPLSEQIIEQALAWLANNQNRPLTIVDVGTGSGCLIITLAKEIFKTETLNNFQFHAIDISGRALKIAKANAKKHKLEGIIHFHLGSLLEPIKNQPIDLILANLPYLDKADLKEPSIKREPKIALVGDFYPKLFKQIEQSNQPVTLIYEDKSGVMMKNFNNNQS